MTTISWSTLPSIEDQSVNFIKRNNNEIIEARFVQRVQEYFIIYLSSHTGCNKACRFCHLTQTGQTSMRSITMEEYMEQVKIVLSYYNNLNLENKPSRVNLNWMARGEALSNDFLTTDAKRFTDWVEYITDQHNLKPKFNLSTIMPNDIENNSLVDMFGEAPINFYYSLYSMDEKFRKRWMPKAMNPHKALDKLAEWQQYSGSIITLHCAFIEGVNDDEQTINTICDEITGRGLDVKFNIVRYNPYSSKQGKESDEKIIQRNFNIITDKINNPSSRIVPRVGHDVFASCGMFVEQ